MSDTQDSLTTPDPETIHAAITAANVSSQLTRGQDALYIARRRASRSELEAAAGANDVMQGADMLAA